MDRQPWTDFHPWTCFDFDLTVDHGLLTECYFFHLLWTRGLVNYGLNY